MSALWVLGMQQKEAELAELKGHADELSVRSERLLGGGRRLDGVKKGPPSRNGGPFNSSKQNNQLIRVS